MSDLMKAHLADARVQLNALQRALRLLNPANQLARRRERLSYLRARLASAQAHLLSLARLRFDGLRTRLESVGPAATLARGYAIVRRADGQVVRSVSDVTTGDVLKVMVADGEFGARVDGEPAGHQAGRRTAA
jgi:exodeoxyribonuclease VII large subunit